MLGDLGESPEAVVPCSSRAFQIEDYQLALVPRTSAGLTGGTPQSLSSTKRALFLPLTWRDLLQQVDRDVSGTPHSQSATVQFGRVRVDFRTMEVTRSERLVALTLQEFKLLEFFVQRPRQPISRDVLLNEVWGFNHYPSTRTVDNHVCKLRKKLEPTPSRPIYFHTVHGLGYKFVP